MHDASAGGVHNASGGDAADAHAGGGSTASDSGSGLTHDAGVGAPDGAATSGAVTAFALPQHGVCTPGGWCWADIPISSDLGSIWGSSEKDIWVVGPPGGAPKPPTSDDGQPYLDDGALLQDSNGREDQPTSGCGGTIAHYDGTEWRGLTCVTTGNAVAGSGSSDVWVVGSNTSFHYDGSNWRGYPSGTSAVLMDVFVAGPDAAWAVGATGTVVHWNGTAWSALPPPSTAALSTVWAFSDKDLWVSGAGVPIQHWDGAAWTAFANTSCTKMWAAGPDALYCGFSVWNGKTWNDASDLNDYPNNDVGGIAWGTSTGSVWQVASPEIDLGVGMGDVFTFEGGVWVATEPASNFSPPNNPPGLDNNFFDLWAAPSGNFYGVGFAYSDGAIFGMSAHAADLNAAVGNVKCDGAPDGDDGFEDHASFQQRLSFFAPAQAWMITSDGGLALFDGHTYDSTPYSSGTATKLSSVVAASATNAWAVGAGGTVVHWDGTAWGPSSLGATDDLTGIRIVTSTDVWVRGNNRFFEYDGTTWAPRDFSELGLTNVSPGLPVGTKATDVSVPLEAWDGTNSTVAVAHWNGSAWSKSPPSIVSVSQSEHIYIEGNWGNSANDMFTLVSDVDLADPIFGTFAGGAIYHWDGATDASLPTPPRAPDGFEEFRINLQATSAIGEELWATNLGIPSDVSEGGDMGPAVGQHFTGTTWETVPLPSSGIGDYPYEFAGDGTEIWARGPRCIWRHFAPGAFEGACGSGTAHCGAGCVDLENDAKNCGSCGTTCPGRCVNATCQ